MSRLFAVSGRRWVALWTTLLIALAAPYGPLVPGAHAQYFGRNKVQYRTFDFKVLKTEHFDIYYYTEERAAAEQAGRMAERWYTRLSRILDHELHGRQPLILYASHPDFEQTNAIEGELGEGTGGVTELLKRRIVLPLAGPLGETDHVIGHELVHAFQFDITRQHTGSGYSAPAAARLPLWFVEGQAEYLSLGPVDPHTAMWIRDAARQNRLPTIQKLGDPRYFPYRYGQALWAYIAGRWGDQAVGQMLKAAGRAGDVNRAVRTALGIGPDTLSRDWHQAIRDWYTPAAAATEPPTKIGRLLVTARGNRGRLNVSPSLSPDGKRLMFLSERDLFSVELYLADGETGKIIRKITRTAVDPHFQSLQFIQSAGVWSPDGRRFAFAAVREGHPILSVIDAESGRIEREIRFRNLGEIFNPTWSPDGGRICFSAIAGGFTDLFVVDLGTQAVQRLTDDAFADIEPSWSPDGQTIAFVTDRFGTDLKELKYGNERLALMDVATGQIKPLPDYDDGKNINPQWSSDGRSLYFVSDHTGISNVYRLQVAEGTIGQVTNVPTGVSGITSLSPAISSARHAGRLVMSVYERDGYNLYAVDSEATLAGHEPATASHRAEFVTLPPAVRESSQVLKLSRNPDLGLVDPSGFKRTNYKAGLSLDYVAQTNLGVATGSSGLAIGGGTALLWSDMLGNHNLATLVQSSNEGGSFVNNLALIADYQNRTTRWNWGVTAGQVPTVFRDFTSDEVFVNNTPLAREQDFRFWEIDREIQGTLAYPFNRVQRVEFSAGYRNVDFVSEVETRLFDEGTGALLSDETTSIQDSIPSLNLAVASAALVYDSSIFGGTSPILGQSYRFEVSPVTGNLHYVAALADYRRYQMLLRPVTLAGRLLHFGRYGKGAEDNRLGQVFVGYPWLIHGYDSESFSSDEAGSTFDRLIGSRIAVANLELRVALLGPLGVVPSAGFLPVEVAGFLDHGVAWREADEVSFQHLGNLPKPVSSYGSALRLNLLGFAVLEWALVHPNDRPRKGWYWQFSIQPGF